MRITLRIAIAVLFVSAPARAQDIASALWRQDTVKSAKLNESRAVWVSVPSTYNRTSDRYPVLVLLDASDMAQFVAAIANIRFLSGRNAIPQLIVVGIPNTRDRTHDLTPAATGATAKQFPTAGGATAFADFISDEVLPMVRGKYRTYPTTILAGHSFGGLFALNIAASRPRAFAGIIAMSPALWWNDTTDAVSYA